MTKINRRKFVQQSGTFTAGAMIIPSLGSYSPANKLNIAYIGVGGRGRANLKKSVRLNDAGVAENNVVALCDVDDRRASESYDQFPKARRFKDFRKMFDTMGSEIDAVVITTPDHTHFAAAMHAMQLGKHVYVDKPLAHNIWQLRTLKKAAKHYNVISQMGNQGHTTDGIRKVKEWYDAGVLGEVKEVIAWFNAINFKPTGYFDKPAIFPPANEPIPEGVDWDLWLGPASVRRYSKYYLPKLWRGWYEYGNGLLGDWSCHTLDAPFWTLDLGMPTKVESITQTDMVDGFVPTSSKIKYHFPKRGSKPPVTLTWSEGIKPKIRPEWGVTELGRNGMIMVGSKKSLITGGRPNEPKLLVSNEEWQAFQENMPAQTIPRVGQEDPQGEWLNAIKGTGPMPGSVFEYGASLTEMALVGVLAQRSNMDIEYDAANMKVKGKPEFDQYIKERTRTGWSYGEDLWK